jgi:hypothetical protein
MPEHWPRRGAPGHRRGLRKGAPPPEESFTVGINRLSIESIDALDDLGANPWRERRFGAHLDKTRSSKHLRRRSIVTGHATIKWSCRFDRKERTEAPRREPLTPPRRRDPVRDLPFSLPREAPYRPHEFPVVVDREQRVRRVAADTLVVGVERATVGRIRPRERRHLDRTRIALPAKERVEIAVCERPESYRQ